MLQSVLPDNYHVSSAITSDRFALSTSSVATLAKDKGTFPLEQARQGSNKSQESPFFRVTGLFVVVTIVSLIQLACTTGRVIFINKRYICIMSGRKYNVTALETKSSKRTES